MSKKIEPTDAMVEHIELGHKLMHMDDRTILRLALNHSDAHGLFTDKDDQPWKSLKKGDPLHAGDEVRQEWYGVTRGGIVGRVDGNGDPWTAEGLSLIHISEPTRPCGTSRMPSSA